MRRILQGGIVALALAGAVPGTALAAPITDFSVARASRTPAAHRIGTLVHFTVVVKNGGPDAAQSMDVTIPDSATLSMVDEVCSSGVSADTPSCEWSNVPAGQKRYARVTFRVVGRDGSHAWTTACATAEEVPNPDPNPANDCVRLSVTVPAP